MNRLTAGLMRDTACQVRVSVARETVMQALLAAGTVKLPEQPAACAVATGGRPILTEFTLAPSVTFFAGEAIEASPGIGNLRGLPPSLANNLQVWLNSSTLVEAALLRGINPPARAAITPLTCDPTPSVPGCGRPTRFAGFSTTCT